MLGKFREDEDYNNYFIPENMIEEFDTIISELGLLDFYCDEWECKYNELLVKFKPYLLSNPVEYYLCDIYFDK